MSHTPGKQAIRERSLGARRSLPDRPAADRALIEAAIELVRGRHTIAAYAPMPGEPGGPGLLDALAAVVPTVLAPVLLSDLDLDWARYSGSLPDRGPRGFAEPDGPRLGLDAIGRTEVVLVPAVAVDRTGVRLGRGGGSYDRALARVSPGVPVVALLYDSELLERLPAEPHDRPVTAALTPSGLHRFGDA